ncbi:MAG: type III pantothenate kinase [Christensenellales bacterium]
MISSVVPTINYTIEHMCRDYFIRAAAARARHENRAEYPLENPRELGSDRIANAVAVSALLRRPRDFH